MRLNSTQLVTPPTEYLISDAEMERHSRTLGQSSDEYSAYVRAAETHVETITGRKLLEQTWKLFLDEWPCSDRLCLPFGQLQSVTHVKYTPSDASQTTFSSDYWEVSTTREPGVLALSYGQSWPSVTLRVLDPIEIQFVCGWATPSAVPDPIRSAVLLIAGHLYEHREDVVIGDAASVNSKALEMGSSSLLVNWRLHV